MRHASRTHLGLATFCCAAAVALAGCGSDSSDSEPSGGGASGGAAGSAGTGGTDTGGTGGTGGTAGTAGSGGAAGAAGVAGGGGAAGSSGSAGTGGTGGNPNQTRLTISGDATWDVTFDADATAAGATNCSYTRHYEGVQDQSRPWVCPSCEVIFRTTVTMPVGLDDCYMQVSPNEPLEEEWVGYGNGTWYRSYGIGASEQGTATVNGSTVTTANSVPDLEADVIGAGMMEFEISGSFTMGEEAGDPNHGWNAADTYSCGWNKANPPEYDGDYAIEIGSMLPDGLFRDKCDEVFRLHDYKGSYVVIFMSAMNCPVCKTMAAGEAEFVADLKTQGIFASTITLMAPSLQDPFGETSLTQLEYWTNAYDIETPVVSDRGWGLTMFIPLYPGEEELGYPAWIVADPDLTVLRHGTGSNWPLIRSTITQDAEQ